MVDEQENNNINIEDLYPNFTPEQLGEAEKDWQGYLAVILQVHERIVADPTSAKLLSELVKTLQQIDELRSQLKELGVEPRA